MINQAQHGAVLFSNRFTPELSTPHYLNSIWLVIGRVSGWLEVSPIDAFTAMRFISVLLFVLALGSFVSVTVKRPPARRVAMFLTVFGGGMGWVFGCVGLVKHGVTPLFLEGRLSEVGLFLSVLVSPHITLAMALILWTFVGFIRCGRGVRGTLFIAPTLTLALATFHPYDVVVIGAVGALFILICRLRDGWFNRTLLVSYLLAMVLSAPVISYQHWALVATPDLRGLYLRNVLPPKGAFVYVIAVFPLGLFSLHQLSKRLANYKSANYGQLLVACWAVMLPIMVYSYPVFQFSLKLTIAMSVPIYILAAEWMHARLVRIRSSIGDLWMVQSIIVALILAMFSSILTIGVMFHAGKEHAQPYFLSRADADALRWLATQPGRDDTVLSVVDHGELVPIMGDKRPVLGHRIQTVDFDGKLRFAKSVLEDGKLTAQDIKWLRSYRVKWIFYGGAERLWWKDVRPGNHMKLVYGNGEVQIFEVDY